MSFSHRFSAGNCDTFILPLDPLDRVDIATLDTHSVFYDKLTTISTNVFCNQMLQCLPVHTAQIISTVFDYEIRI